MLQPPAATPTSRMIRMAASRITWYSRSVSVIAGATVIESPVCTPIGSRFSIEQTITTLSAPSRITSSSNSFQPMMLRSTSTEPDRREVEPAPDRCLELLPVVGDAAAGAAEGERGPDDRRVAGLLDGLERLVHAPHGAALRRGQPDPLHRLRELLAVLGDPDGALVGADQLDAVPRQRPVLAAGAIATLSAVWPPIVGSSASGRSRSITLATHSGVTGSM